MGRGLHGTERKSGVQGLCFSRAHLVLLPPSFLLPLPYGMPTSSPPLTSYASQTSPPQVEHSVLVRSAQPVLDLCAKYGIKVLARGGTLGGLLSAKYLGAPPPDPVRGDADLDSVPGCLDAVNNVGGWARLQAALAVIKGIADKHGVKPETVALRWQIDAGCFPLVTTRWSSRVWRQFGYEGWSSFEVSGGRPGVDGPLFQVESFLDVEDVRALAGLAAVH